MLRIPAIGFAATLGIVWAIPTTVALLFDTLPVPQWRTAMLFAVLGWVMLIELGRWLWKESRTKKRRAYKG